MLSLGSKYRMQSKVKLALFGLLNPWEAVVSLFHSFTSSLCHTSNYKLIGFKCKNGCTSFFLKQAKKKKTIYTHVNSKRSLTFHLFYYWIKRLLSHPGMTSYTFTCTVLDLFASKTWNTHTHTQTQPLYK